MITRLFLTAIYSFLCRQAGCTPFAASLLGDYFTEGLRATSLGIYNWGIYVGYSLSYALGNFITKANILGQVCISIIWQLRNEFF